MHGGGGPIKTPRGEGLKNKDPKAPLAGHPNNIFRKGAIEDARAYLKSLPRSKAVEEAMDILNGMSPESGSGPWALLLSKARETDAVLAAKIVQVCELTHNDALASIKTGADIIPVLHSICSGIVDTDAKLLEAWRRYVRKIVDRFEDGARLDGTVKELIASMARFEPGFDEKAFVILVEEVYAKRGLYGDICDICEEVLGFEDAQRTLHAHAELSIAALADHAAQDMPNDRALMRRCVKILKRCDMAIKSGMALPSNDKCTFQKIAESARSLAQSRRRQSSSFWVPKDVANYPFPQDYFSSRITPSLIFPPGPIWSEQWGCVELDEALSALGESCDNNLSLLKIVGEGISRSLLCDESLQKYVIAMARFGSGFSDGLIYHILLRLFIERGMYMEVCHICEEMVKFKGVDAQRMRSSTLIESSIGLVVHHMYGTKSLDGAVTDRCIELLEARADSLDMGRDNSFFLGIKVSKVRKAGNLASYIELRRRMRKPEAICAWIRGHYPLVYEFLELEEHPGDMTSSKSTLANHVSDVMGIRELSKCGGRPRSSGALDDLKRLLEVLGAIGLDPMFGQPMEAVRGDGPYFDCNYCQWKKRMREGELWQSLLEMKIYVRCKVFLEAIPQMHNEGALAVSLQPRIENKGSADVKVGECHVEAYAPIDTFVIPTGRVLRTIDFIPKLCDKIMQKNQIKSFGDRESILVVDCDYMTFDDQRFRQVLEERVQHSPRLGGVLLIQEDGSYKTFFIRNHSANVPVPEDTVKSICRALE